MEAQVQSTRLVAGAYDDDALRVRWTRFFCLLSIDNGLGSEERLQLDDGLTTLPSRQTRRKSSIEKVLLRLSKK